MKNDSTPALRIKLAIDWLKGIKMDIPNSRWVMLCIGFYVISAALFKLAEAIVVLSPVLK